jgi:hypothetical protein
MMMMTMTMMVMVMVMVMLTTVKMLMWGAAGRRKPWIASSAGCSRPSQHSKNRKNPNWEKRRHRKYEF